MEPLALAVQLARASGKYQRAHLGHIREVRMKGLTDPVTDVDQACEQMILDGIRREFPAHAILAEESGSTAGSEWLWVVDPLDGTVNFTHGYPLFCTCIALCRDGRPELSVIYEPNHDELFVAQRGSGATCNGDRIHVSQTTRVIESLLDTGFAYSREQGELAINIPIFNTMLMRARAVRRDGVAGVDLAYVAKGRYDGFWEFYLRPWDLAAGVLLVEEAGGRVTNLHGGLFDLFGPEVLATNGLIHQEIIEIVRVAATTSKTP